MVTTDTNDGSRKVKANWPKARKQYYAQNRSIRFNRRFGLILKDGESTRTLESEKSA